MDNFLYRHVIACKIRYDAHANFLNFVYFWESLPKCSWLLNEEKSLSNSGWQEGNQFAWTIVDARNFYGNASKITASVVETFLKQILQYIWLIKIILDNFLALNEISSTTLHYYQEICLVKNVFLVF